MNAALTDKSDEQGALREIGIEGGAQHVGPFRVIADGRQNQPHPVGNKAAAADDVAILRDLSDRMEAAGDLIRYRRTNGFPAEFDAGEHQLRHHRSANSIWKAEVV